MAGRFVATNGRSVAVLTCRDGLDCGLRLVDVGTGGARDVAVVPGTQSFTQTTSVIQTGPGSGTLVVGPAGSGSSTGMAPPLAAIDLASATGRAVFLGDVGDPLSVDPTVTWACAGGRGGLHGGRLGEALQPLPVALGAGVNDRLVAITRAPAA